jgi:predicted MarR family transcription regulator
MGQPRALVLIRQARAMALAGACGITDKSLRALTARLLGTSYSTSQMTYDLRRLRLNGLIRRIEHTHTHSYTLTPEDQRLAIFYTKVCNRLLRLLGAADQMQAQPGLRRALAVIDRHANDYIAKAPAQACSLKT